MPTGAAIVRQHGDGGRAPMRVGFYATMVVMIQWILSLILGTLHVSTTVPGGHQVAPRDP